MKFKKLWLMVMMQFVLIHSASAQGFSQQASSMLESIRDGLVLVVGVIATIALLWQLAEGFMGRKTWSDVLNACLWIFGAGAAAAAATWIFEAAQSITF